MITLPENGTPYWPCPPRVGLYRQISYVLHMPIAILPGIPRDISRQRPTPPMAGTNEETTINLKPIDCRSKFPPILPAPICLIFRYASHE